MNAVDERMQAQLDARDRQELERKRELLAPLQDTMQRRLGVQLDPARLDVDEARELRSLAGKVTDDDDNPSGRPAWHLDTLDRRERKRFERLIEKVADAKGLFRQAREQEGRAEASRQAGTFLRLQSRPRRPKFVDAGTVQIPAFLIEWLFGDTDFGLGDLALLVAVLGAIDGRIDHVHGMHVEGNILVIEDITRTGFASNIIDPDQLIAPRRTQLLDWLAENRLLTIRKSGTEWRITRGPVFHEEEARALELAPQRAQR